MTQPTVQSLMTNEQLVDWLLRRLGAPLLKIELTEEHVEDAIQQATRWFTARKGVVRTGEQDFYSGQCEYRLPDDVDVVLDVAFPSSSTDMTMIFAPYMALDERVPFDVFAAPQSAGLYSTFMQTLQYTSTAKRVLGADWDWFQDGRVLHLTPTPRIAGKVIYQYKSHRVTLEQLTERDHDLVKRYALACLKADLGRVRSKHSAMPGAQGAVNLDGEALLTESREDIEKLNEELDLSAFPMGIVRG